MMHPARQAYVEEGEPEVCQIPNVLSKMACDSCVILEIPRSAATAGPGSLCDGLWLIHAK